MQASMCGHENVWTLFYHSVVFIGLQSESKQRFLVMIGAQKLIRIPLVFSLQALLGENACSEGHLVAEV